ncbi:hypothetical protein FocnCong_v010518 [Fusarium oxysporum f. sp. conglutinans]|nr:hypothetical protein FocnCong_v010518 [Fusarium oxysporum f. sp. conglutinans]
MVDSKTLLAALDTPLDVNVEVVKPAKRTLLQPCILNMSSHPFFRSHGRLEEATLARPPSESLGLSRPSTPVSASTRTNDETSRSMLSDERGRSATTGEPVPSIRYRQPHKRVINSKSQPSAICRHSAQLTTDGNNEYGLYKYCHISGRHDAALFASESTTTTGIIYYLQQQHRLEEFGYKATGSDPFSIAKRTASLTPYLGSRRVVFDDLKFKDDFTDWVIVLDLTFRQATHQRTNEIFINYVEDIDKILPKSPSTLSSWVKEK